MKFFLIVLVVSALYAQDQPVEHREPRIAKTLKLLVSGEITGEGFGSRRGEVRVTCTTSPGNLSAVLSVPDAVITSWADSAVKFTWTPAQITSFTKALEDATGHPVANKFCLFGIYTAEGYTTGMPALLGRAR